MRTLIFDIETVGEDFDALDETSKEVLTKWITKESESEKEYEAALHELKGGMGFSPLTGEIVVVGALVSETNKGGVYFQAPGEAIAPFEENGFSFKPMSENNMLQNFWRLAAECDTFVTFNGRSFDVPFLMIRSAIYGIRPTKNLLSNRYLGSQKYGAVHIDLQDQLTFYGAMRRKGGLHMFSRAFGIKSPKGEGITGNDVSRLFREKKYADIARYNVRDLIATHELYKRWQEFLDV